MLHLIFSFKNKVFTLFLFAFFLVLLLYLIDHYLVLVFAGSVINIKDLFSSFIIGHLFRYHFFLFILSLLLLLLSCIFFGLRFFFLLLLLFFLQSLYLSFLCFIKVDLLLDCGLLKIYRLLSPQDMELVFLDCIEKYCAQPQLAHYKPVLLSLDFQSAVLPFLLQHHDTYFVSSRILTWFASICPAHITSSTSLDCTSFLLFPPFDVLSSFFM